MDKAALLHFLESSGKVTQAKAREIAEVFEEKTYEKGAVFIKEGKVSDSYFILAEGFMRSFVIDTDGMDVTTAFYSPVQPVFEVASFF